MRAASPEVIREWFLEGGAIRAVRLARPGIGARRQSLEELEKLLELPASLLFAAYSLLEAEPDVADEALDSIPFYSLCRGFFLPLMGLAPERVGKLFGLTATPPLTSEQRSRLVGDFLARKLGLSLQEKVALVMGDPFMGKPPGVREDTLTRLLARLAFRTVSQIRHSIVGAGDLASLFAMRTTRDRSDLTAAELLTVLRFLKGSEPFHRMRALEDLFLRCGRLEAYVLSALILNKVHLSLSGRSELVYEHLAAQFQVSKEVLATVAALTDPFELARILEHEGVPGLKKVALKPLSPILPALAGATVPAEVKFPAWFECKYDGIRLMLHKATDERGQLEVAGYTRRRHDWSELIPGLAPLARVLPCHSAILDGELHGSTLDRSGMLRPCTVYEVHTFLRGEPGAARVNLRYTAFDLLYLDGVDLTDRPFSERRARLERLLAVASQVPLPLPLELSRGKRVASREEMNRLYEQFRAQGYEGGMLKIESSAYPLATRTPNWMKRKPEETLDLVLTGAFWSDPSTAGKRMFDAYLISCRGPEGLHLVGTVGGVDESTTLKIAGAILQHNLLTGRPIEHRGHQRTAAGLELAPYLVVTVALEGVVRDVGGVLSLRSPRIKQVRAGEMSVGEIATLEEIERRHMREGLG
ncbi:MAG: hypothetical protein AMXMBFR33_72650 [Candidatus Xenobia bacterium]